jgi:hypothetical protein
MEMGSEEMGSGNGVSHHFEGNGVSHHFVRGKNGGNKIEKSVVWFMVTSY